MLTATQFAKALFDFLPKGLGLFSFREGSTTRTLLDAIATEYRILATQIEILKTETNPSRTQQTLFARYEEAGLPEICVPGDASVVRLPEAKKQEISARWFSAIGSDNVANKAYFKAYLASIGVQAVITESWVDAQVGAVANTLTNRFTWNVYHLQQPITRLIMNKTNLQSSVGYYPGDTSWYCLVQRLVPAHTKVNFIPVTTLPAEQDTTSFRTLTPVAPTLSRPIFDTAQIGANATASCMVGTRHYRLIGTYYNGTTFAQTQTLQWYDVVAGTSGTAGSNTTAATGQVFSASVVSNPANGTIYWMISDTVGGYRVYSSTGTTSTLFYSLVGAYTDYSAKLVWDNVKGRLLLFTCPTTSSTGVALTSCDVTVYEINSALPNTSTIIGNIPVGAVSGVVGQTYSLGVDVTIKGEIKVLLAPFQKGELRLYTLIQGVTSLIADQVYTVVDRFTEDCYSVSLVALKQGGYYCVAARYAAASTMQRVIVILKDGTTVPVDCVAGNYVVGCAAVQNDYGHVYVCFWSELASNGTSYTSANTIQVARFAAHSPTGFTTLTGTYNAIARHGLSLVANSNDVWVTVVERVTGTVAAPNFTGCNRSLNKLAWNNPI